MSSRALDVPFSYEVNVGVDSISENQTYDIEFSSSGLSIYSNITDSTYLFKNHFTNNVSHDLPFDILNSSSQIKNNATQKYKLVLSTLYSKVNELKNSLTISMRKRSEIIEISMESIILDMLKNP